ncbi:MAG TPA: phosphoribosylanthranilate isomerase, partial [Chloroflexia bacterium]
DWSLAAGIAERLPLILAGGLNPGNVGAAIEQVAPWAVDVSSGVENGGAKDGALIREFISAASYASVALKGQ